MLTGEEKFYVYAIAILVIAVPVYNYFKKTNESFWSPLTFISLIYAYYALVGPLVAINNDSTYYQTFDHRDYFIYAWKVSFWSLVFIFIGFFLTKKPFKDILPKEESSNVKGIYFTYSRNLTIIGIICVIIAGGSGGLTTQLDFINPTTDYYIEGYGGALRNYFLHGVNLLIAACCLLFVATMQKKSRLLFFLFVLIVAIAVYTKQGFRWRHVVLGLSLIMTYYLYNKKKVNIILFTSFAYIGIVVMGIIGESRSYGTGLFLDKVEDAERDFLFLKGLSESSVFMTTGYLVEKVPRDYPHIGFEPLIQAIVQPIPRGFWEGKPVSEQLDLMRAMYQEVQSMAGFGVAISNYGEMYFAFGYWGVIIGSFLIGFLCKRFWLWFLDHRDNNVAVVLYSVGVSFLYVVVSRGYFPQVFMLFMFTVFPLIWTYRWYRRKIINSKL